MQDNVVAPTRRRPRPREALPTCRAATRGATPTGWRSPAGTASAGSTSRAAEFADEVRRRGQGPHRRRRRARRPRGLMCKTRYEWTLVDFAIWTAGAVTCRSTRPPRPSRCAGSSSDSGAEGHRRSRPPRHAATVAEVRERAARPRARLADRRRRARRARPRRRRTSPTTTSTRAAAGIDRTSLATIIYTSGTTGRPKGCELTHGNFLALAENAVAQASSQVVARDGASTLLFLPLAHVFARFIQVALRRRRGPDGPHAPTSRPCSTTSPSFQPTFILAVPRVFEKIYNSAEAEGDGRGQGQDLRHRRRHRRSPGARRSTPAAPGLGLQAAARGLRPARLRQAARRHGRPGPVRRVRRRAARHPPRPLLPRHRRHRPRGLRPHRDHRAGHGQHPGQGQDRHGRPAAAGRRHPDRRRRRDPHPGRQRLRAATTTTPTATAERHRSTAGSTPATSASSTTTATCAITGRKKELLVTAGGKNVAPAVLEDRLRAHPLVSQCIVVGDQKPFIAALVTLDEEMLPAWAKNNGLEGVSHRRRRGPTTTVLAELQKAVDDANRPVSKAESIRKFAVLPGDFTEENGYLTPSLKLKRNVVMKDFARRRRGALRLSRRHRHERGHLYGLAMPPRTHPGQAIALAVAWLAYFTALQWSVVRYRVAIVVVLTAAALALALWQGRRAQVSLTPPAVTLMLAGSAARDPGGAAVLLPRRDRAGGGHHGPRRRPARLRRAPVVGHARGPPSRPGSPAPCRMPSLAPSPWSPTRRRRSTCG